MQLTVVKPSPQLQPYIKCYYISEARYDGFVKDVFFADGCIEMVFHAGLDFYRGSEKEYWAKALGQVTQPLQMRATGKGKTFGIWFLPHTFSCFCNIPVHELNDTVLPLYNIFPQSFLDFVRNCLFDNNTAALINGVNAMLCKKLASAAKPAKQQVAGYAVQRILAEKTGTDLDRLAKDCNVSTRYLQKLFNQCVGFSPKFLIKVTRFQQALQQLSSKPNTSLTQVTYNAGYYDQAHFIRDFKQFTGMAPSHFKPAHHPINQYFLHI